MRFLILKTRKWEDEYYLETFKPEETIILKHLGTHLNTTLFLNDWHTRHHLEIVAELHGIELVYDKEI